MALTETTETYLNIDPQGRVQERRDRVIWDGDDEVARVPHRRVIDPDADLKDEPAEDKGILEAARTPERLARFAVAKAAAIEP